MKSKRRLALEELARRKKFEDWRKDPMLWVKERLGEDPANFMWSLRQGYENHQWDGDIDPLAESWRCMGKAYSEVQEGKDPTTRYIAVESATGTGKTYAMARIVFWFLDCFPNSLVVTTAPTETQLKLGLWSEISLLYPRIKKLRPNAKKWVYRLALEHKVDYSLTEEERIAQQQNAWHAVSMIAGAKADETSANKARGFHRKAMLIILEECTGIPLPILTAFQNTCTGQTNFIYAVGNPDNEFDTLHQFIQQKDVRGFRVSAYDHPNIVNQKEIIEGAVTQSSINSRTENYGEGSPLWNAMVRGISPTQASDALIRKDWVDKIIDKDFLHDDPNTYSHNALGIDVANSVDGDKAALAFGQANVLKHVHEFQCANATHLAYNVIMDSTDLQASGYEDYNTKTIYDYDISPDCIGVDAVGVGVATVNAFADRYMDVQALQGGYWEEAVPKEEIRQGGRNIERVLYRFATLRAQMYWELREDIRLGRLSFEIEDKDALNKLVKELCIPKFVVRGNYIEVEPKGDIKKRLGGKSPNLADAVVYWNWARKGYRLNRFGWAAISAGTDD